MALSQVGAIQPYPFTLPKANVLLWSVISFDYRFVGSSASIVAPSRSNYKSRFIGSGSGAEQKQLWWNESRWWNERTLSSKMQISFLASSSKPLTWADQLSGPFLVLCCNRLGLWVVWLVANLNNTSYICSFLGRKKKCSSPFPTSNIIRCPRDIIT